MTLHLGEAHYDPDPFDNEPEPQPTTPAHHNRLAVAFIELTGGRTAWEWANLHYDRGMSIRAIADMLDDAPSAATIHRRVTAVWNHCQRYGLLPKGWEKQPQGGRHMVRLHGTDRPNDLHHGNTDRRRNGKNFL